MTASSLRHGAVIPLTELNSSLTQKTHLASASGRWVLGACLFLFQLFIPSRPRRRRHVLVRLLHLLLRVLEWSRSSTRSGCWLLNGYNFSWDLRQFQCFGLLKC